MNFRINGKALHQAHDLLIRQLSHFVFIVWPGKLSILKALIEQPESLAIPIKCLEAVLSTATEKKDAPGEEIEMEALLNYVSKRIDPPTHVGLTANNEDEVRELSDEQVMRLMQGFTIDPKIHIARARELY